jgi:4a-hydroxytetrahydrobiopterin dehydratase
MKRAAIGQRLKRLPGWAYKGKARALQTEIRCKDFMAAVRLIGKIARLAEKADHHPDLHLTRYRRLRVVLSTHEKGAVTEKDFRLAAQIAGL